MRFSRCWILGVVVLALSTGCGGAGDDPPDDAVQVTFGDDFEQVTDTAAVSLTPEQKDEILARCKESAGVPGSNDDCLDSLPSILPPCRASDKWCLYGGVLGDSDTGVLRVVDQESEEPACDDAVCTGITVPVSVVQVVVSATTTSAPAETTGPTPTDPTETGVTTPTPTEPTSTESAVPTPS